MYDVADGGGADGIVDGGYSEVHLPSTYTKHTLTALEPGAVYRMQVNLRCCPQLTRMPLPDNTSTP